MSPFVLPISLSTTTINPFSSSHRFDPVTTTPTSFSPDPLSGILRFVGQVISKLHSLVCRSLLLVESSRKSEGLRTRGPTSSTVNNFILFIVFVQTSFYYPRKTLYDINQSTDHLLIHPKHHSSTYVSKPRVLSPFRTQYLTLD